MWNEQKFEKAKREPLVPVVCGPVLVPSTFPLDQVSCNYTWLCLMLKLFFALVVSQSVEVRIQTTRLLGPYFLLIFWLMWYFDHAGVILRPWRLSSSLLKEKTFVNDWLLFSDHMANVFSFSAGLSFRTSARHVCIPGCNPNVAPGIRLSTLDPSVVLLACIVLQLATSLPALQKCRSLCDRHLA